MQFKNIILSVVASVALINAAAIPPAPAAPATPATPAVPGTPNTPAVDAPKVDPNYQTCVDQVGVYNADKKLDGIPKPGQVCDFCVEWTYGICGAYIYQSTNDDQSLKVTKEACYIEKIQYCRYFNNVGPKVPKPEIPAGVLDPKCPTTYTPKTLNAPAPPATPAKPETPAVAAEPEAPAAPADPAVPEVPTVPATPAEPAAPAAPAAPRN